MTSQEGCSPGPQARRLFTRWKRAWGGSGAPPSLGLPPPRTALGSPSHESQGHTWRGPAQLAGWQADLAAREHRIWVPGPRTPSTSTVCLLPSLLLVPDMI